MKAPCTVKLGRARAVVRVVRSLHKFCIAVLFSLAPFGGPPALGQSPPDDTVALRNHAFELWDRNNYAEALPLLEKLADASPSDTAVLVRLGGALLGSAAANQDAEARKKIVLRARSVLLRARELGDNSHLLQVLLEQIPESGEIAPFSTRQEVDKAVREGEAAFAKSDFANAVAAYERALELDPGNYEAALFVGDVYFRMNQLDKASDWFAKAIGIDPGRETAYRYWGDALMKEGKMDEARAKFIEAVVAEPYLRGTWLALVQWGQQNQATLSHPRIDSPNQLRLEGDKKTLVIIPSTFDKKDGTQYWMLYEITRVAWAECKFAKEFSDEKSYRHTLGEEVEALTSVTEGVTKDLKEGRITSLDPSLAILLKLREQGLLEAYVLLARADKGIAKDYPAYRAAHRDKLRQYISEYVIHFEKPEEPKAADHGPS